MGVVLGSVVVRGDLWRASCAMASYVVVSVLARPLRTMAFGCGPLYGPICRERENAKTSTSKDTRIQN